MEEKTLNAQEIFEQITLLQKEISENGNSSLDSLPDSLKSAFESADFATDDRKAEALKNVCDVYARREDTLQRTLAMLEKMYEDIRNK